MFATLYVPLIVVGILSVVQSIFFVRYVACRRARTNASVQTEIATYEMRVVVHPDGIVSHFTEEDSRHT